MAGKQMTLGVAVLAIGLGFQTGGALAVPAPGVRSAPVTAPSQGAIEQVQWRRGGWYRGRSGAGWGIGAGILGGAILGSALAAPYAGRSYYYYPSTRYYGAYRGGGDFDEVEYCSSRFRSYDPASGTYLGYDGLRHPCP